MFVKNFKRIMLIIQKPCATHCTIYLRLAIVCGIVIGKEEKFTKHETAVLNKLSQVARSLLNKYKPRMSSQLFYVVWQFAVQILYTVNQSL